MAVVATTTPQLRAGTGPWVGSARWDLFWMFSALWSSALCFATVVSLGGLETRAILFGLGAALAVAIPGPPPTSWSRRRCCARRAGAIA